MLSVKHILGLLAALFLVGAGWFGWQAYRVYRAVDKMTGQKVPLAYQEPTVVIPPLNGTKRINILVLGSDNDKKKEEARPLTQSMIIVSLDPVHDKVTMLSIPRDFWVHIPKHGWGKIDLANKYGGIALARATVHELFNIPIHHYAWVGLGGFIKVIDAFNGITLDALHPILDDSYPNDLNSADPYSYKRVFIPAGWQHMDGDQALEYVRSRHGDKISDFGRSERQQQVLLQLDQKINALNVLTRLPELASDLQDSVRTDLDVFQLQQLEQLSHHIKRQNVSQWVLSAPTYSSYGWEDGQSVVIPNWQKIRPLIKQLFAPIVPPGPARPATHPAGHGPPSRPGTATPSRATPAPRATPRPTATATPPPALNGRLPANLFYVQNGNIFELTRNRVTRQLTFTGDAAMPAPSPDGRWLAFVRFYRSAYASDIWLMNLRHAAHWRPLTHDAGAPDVRNDLWAAWPTWSSDGKTLYFSWDRSKLALPPSDARPQDLAVWEMNPWTQSFDSGTMQQLSQPAQGAGGDTETTDRPRHHQILYVRWDYLQSNNAPYSQLVLLDAVSKRTWTLTPVGGRVLQPSWDASGRKLAFVRLTNGVDEIAVTFVADTASGPQLGPRNPSTGSPGTVIARGEVAQPSLSPDGKWVSFLRASGGGFNLYVAPSSGGPSVKVGEVPDSVDARWHPAWGT